MRSSKLQKALPHITTFLESTKGVFKQKDLARILTDKREEWSLPATIPATKLISQIAEVSKLKRTTLTSENYKELIRYTWNDPSPFAVALSLKEGCYLSHASAVYLHGLNEHIPKVIYVNKEQSVKPASEFSLTQEALNRSFGNKQRESKYIFNYRDTRIVILAGKNTRDLEVSELIGPKNEAFRVTKIPRTLIDIAVRPTYAGGVYQVLEAYKGAEDQTTVALIMATLKNLNYMYPYHQAIGFYLTRAGWKSDQVSKLKSLGLQFDFYIDYGIPESQRQYDKEWRLFYPKGL